MGNSGTIRAIFPGEQRPKNKGNSGTGNFGEQETQKIKVLFGGTTPFSRGTREQVPPPPWEGLIFLKFFFFITKNFWDGSLVFAQKTFKKSNPPDFRFYLDKLNNKNLPHMVHISSLAGIKFKIWRVAFFKSFLSLKNFGMVLPVFVQ